jgi:hypothetical protein
MGKTIDVIMHIDDDSSDNDEAMIFDLYEAREGGGQFGLVKKDKDGNWRISLVPNRQGVPWSFELGEFVSAIEVIRTKVKELP